MEKITGFLGFFVFIFLIYSYFKFKKETSKVKTEKIEVEKRQLAEDNNEDYEKHAVAAVIAVLMQGKKYKIRNIFLAKKEKNKRSEWKLSGRFYNMQRRDRV